MRVLGVLLAICAPALAISSELIDSTTVYIQPLTSKSTPLSLAEIKFNPSTLSSEILSYESPLFPEDEDLSSKLLRVGIYDPATATWKSSTSTTSVETFAKGYAPTIVLNLDAQGGVIGVSCKSSSIDAGQTRDFGPKVKVIKMREGAKPFLNRPVVLNPEGKVEEIPTEKTLLQKYWWGELLILFCLLVGLRNGCTDLRYSYCGWNHCHAHDWWWGVDLLSLYFRRVMDEHRPCDSILKSAEYVLTLSGFRV